MIYLDNGSTTKPFPEVIQSFNESVWYNPHSSHVCGQEANKDIEYAKISISKDINCDPEEIFFVSSATEACNWAINILIQKECKLLYKNYEHIAVLRSAVAAPILNNPKRNGYIQMLVNNVYGEIYDIPLRENDDDLIFCDGTAAIGHIPFDFKKSGIDLLAFGAHKFNGLRGAACLIIKKDLFPIHSIILGGDITGGTPCSGLIKAMAIALHKNIENIESNIQKSNNLQNYIIKRLKEVNLPSPYIINTPVNNKKIPNCINISFLYAGNHYTVDALSQQGICVSSGCACETMDFITTNGGIYDGHIDTNKTALELVFEAADLPIQYANFAIRITLDPNYTSIDDCEQFIQALLKIF